MNKGPAPRLPQNPIVVLRRQMGLGQAEFARAIGCSLPALWAAERGTTAHPYIVLRGLKQLGYDPTRLEEEYRQWRAATLEDDRSRLRSAIESERQQPPKPENPT